MHIAKKTGHPIVILTITLISFSCAQKQQQLLFDNKKMAINPKNALLPKKSYVIQPQDVLQIRNLQNRKYIVHEPAALKTQVTESEGQLYEVRPDSTIALPILGHVKIAGLNRSEAAQYIEKLYSKALKDPIIELKIINLKVTILGEVKNQGIYSLVKDHTSVVEIIGTAGGLTDKGNGKNVKIIRRGLQTQQVWAVDLSDINTLSDPEIILQNNDIIYVAQHKKAVRSEKLQSISAILQPVITLLNTVLIIHTLTR